MADLSDVSNALVALIGLVLYPSGASGENPSPVVNLPVRIAAGWPAPAALDADIKAYTANPSAAAKARVSIYPRPDGRSTSRSQSEWEEASINEATFTLVQTGQVVTVDGAQANPFFAQNFVLTVNGKVYQTQSGSSDMATTIAAALQALVVVDVAGTTVSDAAITFPNVAVIGALYVGGAGSALKEIDRQEVTFQITVWSPKPADRDAVTKAIDPPLRAVTNLLLADQSYGRMHFVGTHVTDFNQKQGIFRRDLLYAVDYPTTLSMAAEQIVQSDAVATLTP